MADDRWRGDDPARQSAAGDRVARLDGIAGGGAEAASAPVARLGELLAGRPGSESGAPDGPEQIAGPEPGVARSPGVGLVDLGQVDASDQTVTTADLATDAEAGPGGESGPVALFDGDGLGAGRADVAVAELGPGSVRRRATRGGHQRGDRRTDDPTAGGGRPGRSSGSRRGSDRLGEPGGAGVRRRSAAIDRVDAEPDTVDPGHSDAEERPEGRPSGRRGGGRWGRDRQELDPGADPLAVAREICLRLLTDRARTRQELAQALRRKGVPDEAAHSVLERFDEVGLIDDAAFAGQWVRSRHAHRGLARRAIAVELRRKGVSDEAAGEALAEVDAESEERRARELVDRKLRSIAVGTAEKRTAAARRLVGMLARKGYGAGVAYRVVKEALAERGAEADELGDGEMPEN